MQSLFGTWFRAFREALAYSQAEAAKAADVTESQWQRWDKGSLTPRAKTYEKIAKGLGYGDVQHWKKDFVRFIAEHQEYLDTPWQEGMKKPIFIPAYGKRAVEKADHVLEKAQTYTAEGNKPMQVVREISDIDLSWIASHAKRADFEQRQRSLVKRRILLDEDIEQFRIASRKR